MLKGVIGQLYAVFCANKEAETYTCPQGEVFRTNGTWYKEHDKRGNLMVFKQYKTRSCKSYPSHSQCTRSKNGISRASADVGFMFIAYNLRRICNILTRDQLMEYLRILVLLFLSKTDLSRLKNNRFKPTFFLLSVWDRKFLRSLVSA